MTVLTTISWIGHPSTPSKKIILSIHSFRSLTSKTWVCMEIIIMETEKMRQHLTVTLMTRSSSINNSQSSIFIPIKIRGSTKVQEDLLLTYAIQFKTSCFRILLPPTSSRSKTRSITPEVTASTLQTEGSRILRNKDIVHQTESHLKCLCTISSELLTFSVR